jgi:hypothetical protein
MIPAIRNVAWRIGPTVIVGLTALGVLTGVQLTDAAGCQFVLTPWILELWPPVVASTPQSVASVNTVVSGLLISLAALALAVPRKSAEKVLVAEFTCFVLYLFVLKGGYAVGFSGAPDPRVLWYDALALQVRLLVIAVLASQRLGVSSRFRNRAALLGTTILGSTTLLVIKLAMFPFPLV